MDRGPDSDSDVHEKYERDVRPGIATSFKQPLDRCAEISVPQVLVGRDMPPRSMAVLCTES